MSKQNFLPQIKSRREIWLLAFVLTIAAFFRFYRLDTIPPGLNYDEALKLIDILSLMKGNFAIFFPADQGREPMLFYMNLVTVPLLGADPFALRLLAAFVGVITIAIVYGFTRTVFRSTGIAFLAALFMAISVWHIFFSRYGLRSLYSVPFTVLSLWYYWRALTRENSRRYFIYAGVFTGLGLYTYLNSRLVPFILIVLTIYVVLTDRANWRRYVVGLMTSGIVAFVIFLPLAVYFVYHPDDFAAHTVYLSIFHSNVNGGDLPGTFWRHLVAVLGMFLIQGDRQMYRNIGNRPVFDPLVGALFVVGLVALCVALFAKKSSRDERLRAFMLTIWLLVFLAANVVSDDAPTFIRALPALPPTMILPAWGAMEIWKRLKNPVAQRLGAALLAFITLVSAWFSYRDYFDFGVSPSAYYAFDTHVADSAKWINRNFSTSQIFVAPLWYVHGTMQLITRHQPLKSFESRDTLVLPSRAAGKDAIIAFPAEQEKKAETLGERLGDLAKRETVRDPFGNPIMIVYRVPAQNLPDPNDPLAVLSRAGDFAKPQTTTRATWDALELLGYSMNASDTPKRNLEVTLFLRALKQMHEDYTFSLKVRDAKQRAWGQQDKWLGNNSYPTTAQSPGDLVIEKFYPGLNPCAPPGDYRISIEMYEPKSGRVAALADGNTTASLGTWRATESLGNLYEHLEPAQSFDADVAPQTKLFGFTLTPDEAQAGEEFSFALYFRGSGDGKLSRKISVRLQNNMLAEREIILPPEGRGVCTLFDLRVPPGIAPGARALFVNDAKIGTLSVK